jgi:predicted nuclease of restriction endonuclease-like (RecB) superfamily
MIDEVDKLVWCIYLDHRLLKRLVAAELKLGQFEAEHNG